MQFPTSTAVVSFEQDLLSLCTQSLNFPQFAEAYKNLQNITRRHIHVHEPLIYDSVLVAALAMHVSLPTLRLFGLDYTVNHEFIERLIQHNLQRYYFTGLTVSCIHAFHRVYNIHMQCIDMNKNVLCYVNSGM